MMSDFAFVHDPPKRVGELAAALGLTLADAFGDGHSDMGYLIHDRFSATYAWDMHHERPVGSAEDLGRRTLLDYSVVYDSGQEECEAALRALHGAPQPVADRIRYGPFFIGVGAGGRFSLQWYEEEPDWAVPAADPEERLAQVRALLADGGTLTFKPPMPARELAQALGRPDAIGRSTDVHLSHWVLAAPDGEKLEHLGRTVEATLDRWPSGPDVAGVSSPGGAVQNLGDDDVVRHLRIE